MKIKLAKLVLLFSFLSHFSFAQNLDPIPSRQDDFLKMVEEMQKRQREMIRSLFNDDGNFGKAFDDIEKEFDQLGFGDSFGFKNNPIIGEYDWLDDGQFKTLKLKITQVKDRPLDIKIKDGMIHLKGVVESQEKNSKSIVSFQRSFSLPLDIDQNNPSFENKDGEILIKFPKLNRTSSPLKIQKNSQDQDKKGADLKTNEREPLREEKGDLKL